MSAEITRMVENCAVCQKYQKSNVKHELINNQVPTLPFQIVSSDLFHFEGDDYLLMADSYSGFFDFVKLNELTSKVVVGHLKHWFATHGIPRILYTDNGPQYSALEFADFAKEWEFDHVTSSPHFPRSNGLAERFVQTAKNLLKRCTEDGSDIQLALLALRNTPRDGELQSANQRLMSRILRSTVPVSEAVLKPQRIIQVTEALSQRRHQQKEYADRGAVKPPEYMQDQTVMVQDTRSHTWKEGKIVQRLEQPRSYLVSTADGRVVRRNARDIKPRKASRNDISDQHRGEPPYQPLPEVYNDQDHHPDDDEAASASQTTEEGHSPDHPSRTSPADPIRTRSGRVVRVNRDGDFEYY